MSFFHIKCCCYTKHLRRTFFADAALFYVINYAKTSGMPTPTIKLKFTGDVGWFSYVLIGPQEFFGANTDGYSLWHKG